MSAASFAAVADIAGAAVGYAIVAGLEVQGLHSKPLLPQAAEDSPPDHDEIAEWAGAGECWCR